MDEKEFTEFNDLVASTDVLADIKGLHTYQQIIILATMSWNIEQTIRRLSK